MELRGTLKDFSLPDIIQLVAFGQKTGVLRVQWAGGTASLYFDNGDVVHAEYPGRVGEEAVFALFGVEEGEFQFHTGVPSPDRTITMDATNLVMEAARRLDESRQGAEDGEPGGSTGGNGAGAPPPPETDRPADRIKDDIRDLLRRRFGRRAKRMIQAVDRCGDSVDDLLDLADRVEKYVRVFLDEARAGPVGHEIRGLVTGSAPSDGSSYCS